MRGHGKATGLVLVLLAAGPAGVWGQSLGERVASADGWVTFQVEVRDGVEVCPRGIRTRHGSEVSWSRWEGGPGGDEGCMPGPLQVEAAVEDGRILDLRPSVPRVLEGARALGVVDSREASDFLVNLAWSDAAPDAAEAGFFLAGLPRNGDPAPGILRAAGDRALVAEVRRSALFWAGQLAAREVAGTLDRVAREADAEQEVRDAAVFALSQHSGEAAVPILMELALDAPHPKTRRTALFWLSQHDSPEVVDFLRDLIMGRRGG